MDGTVMLMVYSAVLAAGLALSSPWWLRRMATSGRYRAGLRGRLGRVPAEVLEAVRGRRVVWVHAVSVGEVFAAVRLVEELGEALGPEWMVVVSTTTATGQKVARERFGAGRVFWYPLDFAFAVRRVLRALKPEALLLMESELWPRMLGECGRAGVPVVVVNARMSDRSFTQARGVRRAWLWMARRVRLWLAQGDETARRLLTLGVMAERVHITGNLKYDLKKNVPNEVANWVRRIAGDRRVVVGGSLLGAGGNQQLNEEEMLVQAWEGLEPRPLLVLATRHPERFGETISTACAFRMVRASLLKAGVAQDEDGVEVVVLDTLGDLAAVYGVANAAFVGGSLVRRGGHNPLEAARFGVPVVMGASYENFREMVEGMREVGAIRITDSKGLAGALREVLWNDGGMGERGRRYFESKQGATERVVKEVKGLLGA